MTLIASNIHEVQKSLSMSTFFPQTLLCSLYQKRSWKDLGINSNPSWKKLRFLFQQVLKTFFVLQETLLLIKKKPQHKLVRG